MLDENGRFGNMERKSYCMSQLTQDLGVGCGSLILNGGKNASTKRNKYSERKKPIET